MVPAFPQPTIEFGRPSRRQRTVTLGAVALLHLLLLLLVLWFAPPVLPERIPVAITTLSVFNVPKATPDSTRAAKAQSRRSEQAREAKQPRSRPARPQPPPNELTAPKTSSIWSQVIPLSHDQLASVDKAMTAPPERAQQSADAGTSGSMAGATDSSDGPGTGPNGETLYNARWYREPTDAELRTYMPAVLPRKAWGIIACKTAPRYHVEDCVEIAQTPGSGLAGTLRQAAWQFLVFPPRIGGRLMVGSWVRIRFDFTVTEKTVAAGE